MQAAWNRDNRGYGECRRCGAMLIVSGLSNPADRTSELFYPCDVCPSVATAAPDTSEEFATRSRIPTRYTECRIETWEPANGEPRHAVEVFTDTWPPAHPILLMSGTSGTGKTHLAIGAMRYVHEVHGKAARFWPVVELLERFKATFDEARATETLESVKAEMRRTPLLVLDDFGAHKSTEWAEEQMFQLIDERYRDRRPLIVTTNLTVDQIPPRTKSRLASGMIVMFVGRDRRVAG